jgi:hypothetical protein
MENVRKFPLLMFPAFQVLLNMFPACLRSLKHCSAI